MKDRGLAFERQETNGTPKLKIIISKLIEFRQQYGQIALVAPLFCAKHTALVGVALSQAACDGVEV